MRFRTALTLLAAGAVLPLSVFSVVAIALLAQQERETVLQESMSRAISGMSAVDAELRGSITSLQALGTSSSLERGDIRAFYEEAKRVLASQPYWLNIGMATPAGEQIIDAVLPYGGQASFVTDDAFELAVRTQKPVVSGVTVGTAVRRPLVRLRLPVVVSGTVRYVLSAPLDPRMFQEILREQRIEGAAVALSDKGGRLIARIPALEPGTPASDAFTRALTRAGNDRFRTVTSEGDDAFVSYSTSALSGWVFSIAVPSERVDAIWHRPIGVAVGGIVLAFMTAMALGWWLSRRIARPIAALAEGADAMARGEVFDDPPPTRIEEVQLLRSALRRAEHAIGERKLLADGERHALEREQTALRSADTAKNEFIATLSHELRNPLAALSAAAHLLKRAPDDARIASQAREVVERQTAHMNRLIEDLLDVSRIASGKAELRPQLIDLARDVGEVVESWRSGGRFAEREVSFEAHQVLVHADPARIDQIVSNLFDNAVKFTFPGGSIRIVVRPEGDAALIAVSDDGEGIDPGQIDNIFGLFVQRSHRSFPQQGLGIGLAMVKKLVEMQGGAIRVASAGLGRGATFTVELPAAPQSLPVVQSSPAQGPVPLEDRRRIVVIDDSDDIRDMLAATLELDGHEVQCASNGPQGIDLVSRAQPHVVLLDIGLPGMNGHEVARRLRKLPNGDSFGLIAVTGFGQAGDLARAEAAGFDRLLVKPVSLETVNQAMAQVIAARAASPPSTRPMLGDGPAS